MAAELKCSVEKSGLAEANHEVNHMIVSLSTQLNLQYLKHLQKILYVESRKP